MVSSHAVFADHSTSSFTDRKRPRTGWGINMKRNVTPASGRTDTRTGSPCSVLQTHHPRGLPTREPCLCSAHGTQVLPCLNPAFQRRPRARALWKLGTGGRCPRNEAVLTTSRARSPGWTHRDLLAASGGGGGACHRQDAGFVTEGHTEHVLVRVSENPRTRFSRHLLDR